MRSIATMALKDGMILAGDVYSFKGNLIAREWDEVDQALINRLSRHCVMCVDIKEPEELSSSNSVRTRSSQAFRRFEKAWQSVLDAYRFMLDAWLAERTPLNTSYLLTLRDQLLSLCHSRPQLLEFLYHLDADESARRYSHLLSASLIATAFGEWAGLSGQDQKLFALCGFVYDIGMLGLPDDLQSPSGALTMEKQAQLRTHTVLGYEMLKGEKLNEKIKLCALHHHERCDGSGYLDGLKGDAIDPFSQAIAIVDDYESMSFSHAFGEELTPSAVISGFERQGLSQYDTHTLRMILKNYTEDYYEKKLL